MDELRTQLLRLLIDRGAIKIAKSTDDFFVFKSGRRSPNFANFGGLTDGESLALLGKAYAQAVVDGMHEGKVGEFQYVFGPAYKGISLAALTVEALYRGHGMKVRLLYDRKEEKAHGENSSAGSASKLIVGAEQFKEGSGILMVDDVVTTGQTKFDALQKLDLLGSHSLAGLVIALDRQERVGDAEIVGDGTPLEELEKRHGIRTVSILNMQQVFAHMQSTISPAIRSAWVDYYRKYGSVSLE